MIKSVVQFLTLVFVQLSVLLCHFKSLTQESCVFVGFCHFKQLKILIQFSGPVDECPPWKGVSSNPRLMFTKGCKNGTPSLPCLTFSTKGLDWGRLNLELHTAVSTAHPLPPQRMQRTNFNFSIYCQR